MIYIYIYIYSPQEFYMLFWTNSGCSSPQNSNTSLNKETKLFMRILDFLNTSNRTQTLSIYKRKSNSIDKLMFCRSTTFEIDFLFFFLFFFFFFPTHHVFVIANGSFLCKNSKNRYTVFELWRMCWCIK